MMLYAFIYFNETNISVLLAYIEPLHEKTFLRLKADHNK